MTELIEYLASEDLGRAEQVTAYIVGVTVAIAVLAFFGLTIA